MSPAEMLALVQLARMAIDLLGAAAGEPMTPEEMAKKKAAMRIHLATTFDLWDKAKG